MSALSDNVQVQRQDGQMKAHRCAVDTIYEGAICKINAAGFLAPAAAELGAVFAGIAVEKVANESPYSAGDQYCRVYKTGIFLLTGSGFAQADVGLPVYATDDQTITKTNAADKQLVGTIEEYHSSTQVWVRIDRAVQQSLYGAHIADVASAGASYVQAEVNAAITALNAVIVVLRKAKMISEST